MISSAMQPRHYLATLSCVAIGISACVGMKLPPQEASLLTCEPLTRNARGDIDPVPSPNGEYVAYRRMTDKSPHHGELHYLHLDQPSESHILLGGDEFHGGVSWSPDNDWISYTVFERKNTQSALVENSVYKVNIHTKEKIRLADGWITPAIGEYTSWTARNEIIFATPDGFYSIDADGGTPKKKLKMDLALPDEPLHLAANSLGNAIAFSLGTSDRDDTKLRPFLGIWLADLDTGRVARLTDESPDSFPIWQDDRTILFLRESAQPGVLNLHTLSLPSGETAPVEHQGIVYSIAQIPNRNVVFAATAPKWDLSGNDFNLFRGFSISKCTRSIEGGSE